ncbi:MAG: DNA polymerase IV [Desulfovibrionaceae bacterium]|nr:DNA polymerase IV [Desulfovibrionaceae bacterium]MBF0514123.1 DNA polymerase IV [Desulfovibrionaceae bacterium]
MHIDMDAFFTSVEQADDPSLRGRPVIVGQDARGVVSAASYEARAFGVHSAMPVVQARRLCPQGVFLPGRMRRYGEASRQVMAVFSRFSPVVEQASVDEAYVDITGTELLFGPSGQLARALQDAVAAETGLSCSIGVAPVKFLAKIASDFRKPRGVTVIEDASVMDFLSALPVSKIPGVGGRTLEALLRLGVRLAGDIRRYPEEFWRERYGVVGETLWERAHGRGSDVVRPHREAKSSGAENTFAEDTADRGVLAAWLLSQAERVGRDLRRQGVSGRTVTIKLKFEDFKTLTRSKTLSHAINADEIIYRTALDILSGVELPRRLRLIGLSVSGFSRGGQRASLAPDRLQELSERYGRLDGAVDAIRDKFGKAAIKRGKLA